MESTEKLQLPYLMAAQAQKHVTHNEALRMLDSLVQLSVLSRMLSEPPASPTSSDAYLVATGATLDWTGHNGEVAVFVDGFWLFLEPKNGWRMWIEDEAQFLVFNGNEWSSVIDGSIIENLQSLGIRTEGDSDNALTIAAPTSLFSHEGAGHQLKINKNADSDTGSILFQTDFSGRAEFGLTGDDDWHVKVSSDGTTWNEAIVVDAESGSISFPGGTQPDMLINNVAEAGGDTFVLGPPNLKTVAYQRSTLAVTANRMYFAAFYVDRPTELLGGLVTQNIGSSTTGALLRAGIYELGQANSSGWDVGALVADFGTRPGDASGQKAFDLAAPIMLSPGWYLSTVGINGAGAQIRYHRWLTPGLIQYIPYGSGSSLDARVAGPSAYLFSNASASEIINGLPAVWPGNPVSDTQSIFGYVYQLMIPKWTRW